jgi:hypothetical protein
MMAPAMFVRPRARALPAACGIHPSADAVARTRARTSGATFSGLLKARETVAVETPAATATSCAVGGPAFPADLLLGGMTAVSPANDGFCDEAGYRPF